MNEFTVVFLAAIAAIMAVTAVFALGTPGGRLHWLRATWFVVVAAMCVVMQYFVTLAHPLTRELAHMSLWVAGTAVAVSYVCLIRRVRAMLLLTDSGWTVRQAVRGIGYIVKYYGEDAMTLELTVDNAVRVVVVAKDIKVFRLVVTFDVSDGKKLRQRALLLGYLMYSHDQTVLSDELAAQTRGLLMACEQRRVVTIRRIDNNGNIVNNAAADDKPVDGEIV